MPYKYREGHDEFM